MEKQVPLHTVACSLHPSCLMADSKALLLNGIPREERKSCDNQTFVSDEDIPSCTDDVCLSCDKCDVDFCSACVTYSKLSEEEKKELKRKKKEEKKKMEMEREKRAREKEEERKRIEQEREEKRKREEKERKEAEEKDLARFPTRIKKPSAANKNKAKLLKYVVYSTDGYLPDPT